MRKKHDTMYYLYSASITEHKPIACIEIIEASKQTIMLVCYDERVVRWQR